jgi:hypothetical protein
MVMRKIRLSPAVSAALALTLSACVTHSPSRLYEGPEKPGSEIALYSPLNRGDFTGPAIRTTHMNGKTLPELFPGQPISSTIALEPGEVAVRISFDVYEDTILWTLLAASTMKVKNFMGWYDLAFEAKPGKLYLPIFNYNLERDARVTQMCISELPQGSSYADSRKPQRYLVCADPSIPATEENIKLCAEFRANNPSVPSKEYEGFCRNMEYSKAVVP